MNNIEYYCDKELAATAASLGFAPSNIDTQSVSIFSKSQIPLVDIQLWLMNTFEILVYPIPDKYLNPMKDDEPTWECAVYIPTFALKTVGRNKNLSYLNALQEGVRFACNLLEKTKTK